MVADFFRQFVEVKFAPRSLNKALDVVLLILVRKQRARSLNEAQEILGILIERIEPAAAQFLPVDVDDRFPRDVHDVGGTEGHDGDRQRRRERKQFFRRVVDFLSVPQRNRAVRCQGDATLVHDGDFAGHARLRPAELA